MNEPLNERHNKITTCVVAVLCVMLSAGLIVMPRSYWSDNENRQLATMPEFSAQTLAEGEYLTGVEDFLTDHFPLRDFFVSVNTRFNTLIGRREINGVFICEDGFLIDKYSAPVRTDAILSALNRLPKALGEEKVTLLLAPTASAIYSDKLPLFAQQADQLETMRQYYDGFDGRTVDAVQTLLEHKREHQLYYRTDHHWTTYGAYYAYAELCAQLGLEAIPLESIEFRLVSEDFKGTTYSKVNDFSVSGEDMYMAILPGQNLSVEYGTGEDAITGSLYSEAYLSQKDKYSFFLDNIHEQVTIYNPQAQTDRELVLIKDSYANCLVPFLTEHFARITVIDLRHYRGSVIDLVNADQSVTDVLILYNLGTIDTDSGVTAIY